MGNFGGDRRTKQGDEILMCCAVLPAEQPKGREPCFSKRGLDELAPNWVSVGPSTYMIQGHILEN